MYEKEIEVKVKKLPEHLIRQVLGVFMDEYSETLACILVYAGNEVRIIHEKIAAVPWFLLGGHIS